MAIALCAASCSGGEDADEADALPPDSGDAAGEDVTTDVEIESLAELLPEGTRGVFALTSSGLSGESASALDELIAGDGTGALFENVFAEMGDLAAAFDTEHLSEMVLVDLLDLGSGRLLVATTEETDITRFAPGLLGDGQAEGMWWVFAGEDDRVIAVGPSGWLLSGSRAAVEAAMAAPDQPAEFEGPLEPYLSLLDTPADFRFAYGLPGLFGDVGSDRSLRGALVMSGALDVDDAQIGGEIAFHTDNAEAFVAAYNQLDRHASGAPDDPVAPLTLDTGVDGRTDRVSVVIPPSPLTPTPLEATESRNVFKKLFVGMDAHEYAEAVVDGGAPWFDLIVKSEADGDDPPAPASVFFRWEFKDEAAIAAFEENELPAGYTIAPTRFFESDDPDGQYFFLLNLYNAGGGSVVGGARAEWDVYVNSPPGGPDPNPGERPRFFVVDALAETVSFDPVNLVTTAEPVSHRLVDGVVTSTVGRLEEGEAVPVWESTFPAADPNVNEVTRFTPEMAIGNDYIYWGGGAADRLLYNATTYNHDAYLIDPADVSFTDFTRWSEYLKPDLLDVVYYVNTLEYIVSPLNNLDSDQLDVTPEWREELIGFKGNGHQEGLMRKRVDQMFRGVGDAMVGYDVSNETPSAFYHFEVVDPEGFGALLELPAGHSLAPITVFDGDEPAHYLTLSVFEIDGATEGVRAEWSTTTDPGTGRPKQVLLDLMTEDVAVDPLDILHLPDLVEHGETAGGITTRLSSTAIDFAATIELGEQTRALSTDWVEAGDLVCRTNGICDAIYYDAETLDVPVDLPAAVTIETMTTPWDDVIETEPAAVFSRANFQEYAAKRWLNLDVEVEELPFAGLVEPTHRISGTGSLVGRDTEVVNSSYTYRGDARIDGEQLTFAIDQEIDGQLGVGNIFTTGSFDLRTGTGTQTVVDCLGPALLCSDIVPGTTSIYEVDPLDASDPDSITWRVDLTLVLTGSFGTADSASAFEAVRVP